MSEGPAPLSRLTAELSQLPGIGRRTAQRLAFHILRSDESDARSLAEAIVDHCLTVDRQVQPALN